jgi:hypothetical protein
MSEIEYIPTFLMFYKFYVISAVRSVFSRIKQVHALQKFIAIRGADKPP